MPPPQARPQPEARGQKEDRPVKGSSEFVPQSPFWGKKNNIFYHIRLNNRKGRSRVSGGKNQQSLSFPAHS